MTIQIILAIYSMVSDLDVLTHGTVTSEVGLVTSATYLRDVLFLLITKIFNLLYAVIIFVFAKINCSVNFAILKSGRGWVKSRAACVGVIA